MTDYQNGFSPSRTRWTEHQCWSLNAAYGRVFPLLCSLHLWNIRSCSNNHKCHKFPTSPVNWTQPRHSEWHVHCRDEPKPRPYKARHCGRWRVERLCLRSATLRPFHWRSEPANGCAPSGSRHDDDDDKNTRLWLARAAWHQQNYICFAVLSLESANHGTILITCFIFFLFFKLFFNVQSGLLIGWLFSCLCVFICFLSWIF